MVRGQLDDDFSKAADAVLQSDTFRNAPSSRRLLRYLADHEALGTDTQLKEYTIGVDAFAKPEGYDPRQDSTVRIQVGRLRQKLAEYYRTEGTLDPLMLELPKGRLKVICVPRPAVLADVPEPAAADEEPLPPENVSDPAKRWRIAAGLLALALVVTVAAAVLLIRRPAPDPAAAVWTPELEEIWHPFTGAGKPLLVSFGDPLFLQFQDKTLFRDPAIDKWDGLRLPPQVELLSRQAGSKEIRPVHYYAAVADVNAAFLLGRRIGPRQPLMSLVRSSQLLWQQMADSNVLLLGPPRIFGERLGSLPVSLEIRETPEGFRVMNPRPGEPELVPYRDTSGFFAEDGEGGVLVTHASGPQGTTDVMIFASNSTFGRMGAVNAFTDPRFAATLTAKLKGSGGRMPRYYQVLLKVKYKSGVPTETSYLLHREIRRRE